jgi:predicted anti-sigma-YlaC factor YlaD
MSRCDEVQELLSAYLEGDLDEHTAREVKLHLTDCEECAGLTSTLELIAESVAPLRQLEPPRHLQSDVSDSPCRRWLGLLFSAVDREINETNLERLLSHLEVCPSCRRAWNDLTLIHQVGEAMAPPAGLLERCISVRRAIKIRPILSRRVAVAAAYVLAVLASLMVGNPVSIARSPVVQRVAESVTTEVNQVAVEGRGELRVMAWRAWQWGNRQIAAVRDLLSSDADDDQTNTDSDQGDLS